MYTTTYSMNELQVIEMANQLKEHLIYQLEKDKLLDSKAKAAEKYVFTIAKKNILGRLASRILGVDQALETVSFVLLMTPKN